MSRTHLERRTTSFQTTKSVPQLMVSQVSFPYRGTMQLKLPNIASAHKAGNNPVISLKFANTATYEGNVGFLISAFRLYTIQQMPTLRLYGLTNPKVSILQPDKCCQHYDIRTQHLQTPRFYNLT